MRKCLGDLERGKSMMMLALSADEATLSMEIKDGVEDLTHMFQKHSTGKSMVDMLLLNMRWWSG
jgi:hypothetical protein